MDYEEALNRCSFGTYQIVLLCACGLVVSESASFLFSPFHCVGGEWWVMLVFLFHACVLLCFLRLLWLLVFAVLPAPRTTGGQ